MTPGPGEGFEKPTVRPLDSKDMRPHEELASYSGQLERVLTEHITQLTKTRPMEMAALFVAVANDFKRTGTGLDGVAPLGKAKSFRLVRTAVAGRNAAGTGLVIAKSRDPLARTASGASLLDIGLEMHSTRDAKRVLAAIADHPVSKARPVDLVETVQRSLGKLIERHPKMLPQAMALGAVADDVAIAAWECQHPSLKNGESRAAMNAAMMAAQIARSQAEHTVAADAAVAETANDSAPRRRRMGI